MGGGGGPGGEDRPTGDLHWRVCSASVGRAGANRLGVLRRGHWAAVRQAGSHHTAPHEELGFPVKVALPLQASEVQCPKKRALGWMGVMRERRVTVQLDNDGSQRRGGSGRLWQVEVPGAFWAEEQVETWGQGV